MTEKVKNTVKKAPKEAKKPIDSERKGTVHRVIDILSALAEVKTDIGVGELAKQVNLPFPTIHRLLHLLKTEGIVNWSEDTHRYSIGPELLRISCQVQSSFNVVKLAEKYLTQIRDVTGETVVFGLYLSNSSSVSFVSTISGPHSLQYRFEMNSQLSLVFGASGKSILAYLSDEEVERAYEQETNQSESGAIKQDLAVLKDELECIKEKRYSVTEGERLEGAKGIAAPIFDASGIFGCFCIICPKERIPLNRVSEFSAVIKQAANDFSHTLGDKGLDNR